MKTFTKRLRRLVRIPSSDRAIPTAEWVLELDDRGVQLHRLGHRRESWRLTWRQVIGHALLHNAGRDRPAPPVGTPPPSLPAAQKRRIRLAAQQDPDPAE